MVYNGRGEIGLVVAVNFFCQKRLLLARNLEVAIKFGLKFKAFYYIEFNAHPQKSRNGH